MSKDIILVAPPGAGKSTCLPLHLLKLEAFKDKKIIMLQPRRVAVRAIAQYLASQLGEPVGQTVGYRIRGESKVSRATRLEIVTEGLLTRKVQQDPELQGVGLILFDEFHERSIHADFSLALCIEVQQGLRDDLRLMIMSATLDVLPIQGLLPDAEVIESEGRSFPVDIQYRPVPAAMKVSDWASKVTLESLHNHPGNILVFLPGSWEIEQLAEYLNQRVEPDTQVYPLYGNLGKDLQQKALAVTPQGQRKVVLATNIAETSLTIDGISVVVDSGLEKRAQFNLNRGITQLRQQMVSQASSVQRAGRAGRLQAGICYRLWDQEKQTRLAKQTPAQILETDLAPFVMEAALWGSDLEELSLLDQPAKAQLEQAYRLLVELEATDQKGKLTGHGRALASLGCHPRLANMLIHAKQLGASCASLACLIVALLESRDLANRKNSASLSRLIEWICQKNQHPSLKAAGGWAKRLGVSFEPKSIPAAIPWIAVMLGYAYPDHIAKNRGQGRFLLCNGTGAVVNPEDPLSDKPWLVIADMLLTQKADAKVIWAEEINLSEINEHFSHLIEQRQVLHFDEQKKRIECGEKVMLGAIELDNKPSKATDQEEVNAIWSEVIRKKGLEFLAFPESLNRWLDKLALAHSLYPQTWPSLSPESLLDELENWLWPYLDGIHRVDQLVTLDWHFIIQSQLDWSLQQQLQEWFPDKFKVPSGSSHALRYEKHGVVLAVRMQEMYGLSETPTIANGKLALQLELLSPAGRPLQTTKDLAGFWKGSYAMVQKEMKGRYPKHFWPDNPANAVATTRTKKHM